MTIAVPYLDRFGFALAGGGAGLALARLTSAPMGHVAAIAALAAALGLVIAAVGLLADRKRARRASSKVGQALRIIESMPALAWFADVDGKFLYVNRNSKVVTGLPKEALDPTNEDEFGFRNVIHPEDLDRVLKTWRRSLRTGDDYKCEHRMWRADNGYRWHRSFGLPARGADGRVVGWYGTTVDIDELKVAEAALREQERSLQQLIDTVPALIGCLSPQGNPVYFNKQMVEYTGLPLAQLGSFDAVVEVIVHPDDVTAVHNGVQRGIETGEPYGLKFRLRRSDGVYRWVDSRAVPMRNAEGEIVQWYGVCFDVDAQMYAEEALRRSERKLQQLIDAVPAMIWSKDPDGKLNYVSKRFTETTGAALEDATTADGMSCLNVVHPEDRAEVDVAFTRACETGTLYLQRHRQVRSSGTYRWTESRAEPLRDDVGNIIQWYGVSVDIHDMTVAQETLRDRERELSQLVDMVPSQVWRLTPDGEPTFFNKRMVDYLGFDVADTDKPGMSRLEAVIETVHPDDAAEFRNALNHCLASGESFVMRYRLRRADGVYRWMSSRAEPLRDQGGRIVQWYGLCHDIEDQMRLYSDIAEREARIRRLIDSDIIGIVIWDLDGTLIDANDAFLRMVQYERADLQACIRWLDITPPDWQEVHAREEAEELAATGKMQAREKEYFRKDGSRVSVLIGAACFEGQSRQGVAYILDLTERKRAEVALRESERRLQQLVDTVPTQIWCVTPEGEPSYINKTMMDYIGMKLEDFDAEGGLRGAIGNLVHPDDRETLYGALSHSFRTGETLALRFRNRRGDGVYRWQEGRAEPLRNESGDIIQWYGANVDIDDMLATEEALRNSTRQLQQMIDAVPANILSYDPAGKLTSVSKRYLEDVGTPSGHIEGFEELASRLAHPDDLPVMLRRALYGFATGTPFVNRFRRRDRHGAYPWIEARAQPLRDASGAIVQWYQVSIDIDGEVRAHEALRKREQELSQLVDALPVHIWSWTPDGKLAYVNKRSLEDLGLSSANFEDTTRVAQELVHPEDAPEVLRTSLSCLKTGDPFLMRYRRRWKDRNYRWIEARCEPLRDQDGTIIHWYQVSIDIDDQVRAHEALRQSERSLRQLVETLPAMIDCAAPNGEPIYRSQQLRQFLGYDLEALDGTGKTRLDGTLDAGVHPADVAGVKERYAHSLATGEPFARRHRLRRFDGEYRWVETRAEAMRNAEGTIVQWNVMCMDVDGEVRAQEALHLAQERLARASQAASLAELSASIAHEVNQPLAAVVANSHACQRWLTADPPNIERAHRTVERIIRDANAAADVVRRIRALFKQSMDSCISMTLDSIITEARELMAEEALRRSVRMQFEVESDLPPVVVDRVQIQQVLINLTRNGMEAMDGVANDRVLRVRVRRVAEVLQVEVHDRGHGIEHPERIFEPFFTTKGHGMGMGLAICRSIIESHGGKLWAETNEPLGATFIFTLPIEVKGAV